MDVNMMWKMLHKVITSRDLLINKIHKKVFEEKIQNKFHKLGKNFVYKLPVNIQNPENISLGDNCYIREGVIFYSEHSDSKMIIGNNVFFGKNVQVDFTGGVIIEDDTEISEGVLIYSHDHDHFDFDKIIPYNLHIGKHVRFGARCIILPKINMIGDNSIIGAGAVVTKEVRNNVVVGGNPAKVLKEL